MEGDNTRRRLKRNSAVTGFSSSEEAVAEQPTHGQTSSPTAQEFAPNKDILGLRVSSISVYTEEETDDKPAEFPPVKKKAYKKGHPLVDYELFHEDSQRIVLEEVQIPTRNKKAKPIESLLEKCEKKNVFKDTLAKNILQDHSHAERLVISAPAQVHGFFSKRTSNNPREQLKDQLRNAINSRKTTHLDLGLVFQKSQSDFVALNNNQEEKNKDSMLIQDIIQLEEGDGSASENAHNQLSCLEELDEDPPMQEDLENSEELEDLEYSENEKELSDIQTDSKTIAIDQGKDTVGKDIHSFNSETPCMDLKKTESQDTVGMLEDKLNRSDSFTRCDSDYLSQTLETKTSDLTESASQEKECESQDNIGVPSVSPFLKTKGSLSRFIDNMAEVGSDNEDHDYVIKRVSDHEELSEDGELEELIDNKKVNMKRKALAKKHMGEMMVQDYQDLVKVINADFRRRRDDYLDDSPGLGSKMMKLMKDKQKEIEDRSFKNAFSRNHVLKEVLSSEEEDDLSKIHLFKTNSQLRNFRSQNNLIIDDASVSYLEMIKKPQNFKTVRSLLSDTEKSNSLKVFREQSMGSIKAFSFKDNSK